MRGRPGSAWWLLQHELRMFWFNNGGRRNKRNWLMRVLGVLWLGLHVPAYLVLREMPSAPAEMVPWLAVGITLLMVVIGTFMFSSALKASVDSLFERGDVDLLLSSPLPSRSIFTVRLGALTLGVASVYLALVSPLVNAALVLGHARALAVYAVILATSALCSALAMLLTLLLVRVLGARKTRVVAQILSAIAGALFFLLAQAQNFMHGNSGAAAKAMVLRFMTPGSAMADSVVWSAGRAAMGQMLPLLCLLAAALALYLFTVQFTHGFFVRGLQQAVSSVRAHRKGATQRQGQFGRHLFDVVLRKEWRLIARDPQLLSQVLLQLLYLLPLGFVLLRSDTPAAPGLAAGLVMLSASLTASLTWIIVAAEDAPDLLQASPSATRVIRQAKLCAAVTPVLLLTAIPLLWAVAQHPVSGLLMCFTVVAASLSAAITGLWQGRPAKRGAFKARGKGNFGGIMLDLVGNLAWAGTAFVLVSASNVGHSAYEARWAGIGLAIALLTLFLAWATRLRHA